MNNQSKAVMLLETIVDLEHDLMEISDNYNKCEVLIAAEEALALLKKPVLSEGAVGEFVEECRKSFNGDSAAVGVDETYIRLGKALDIITDLQAENEQQTKRIKELEKLRDDWYLGNAWASTLKDIARLQAEIKELKGE